MFNREPQVLFTMEEVPRETDSGPPTLTNTTDDSRQSLLQNKEERNAVCVE
jgi:hypothetical protein|tara:strand:- start:286 stop:438 length:153 start_codon:yes stop_codon:yes gene_type:complete